MVKTIGNPGTWGMEAIGSAGAHVASVAGRVSGARAKGISLQDITSEDIRQAIKAGWDDFKSMRSDVLYVCILYPIIGALLVFMAMNRGLIPLVAPLIAGFALIGPVAAVGLYEMSRRREAGETPHWTDAFSVLRSPAIGPILVLGIYLLAIFVGWMLAAAVIYHVTMGPGVPASMGGFVTEALTTGSGWAMILIGIPVGAIFAALTLAISVIAFPLMIDKNVGVVDAVAASATLTRQNPATVARWGLLVGVMLIVAAIPLFLGMIVVLPVLGHATWHLYRRAVGLS